jgi:MFS family permease
MPCLCCRRERLERQEQLSNPRAALRYSKTVNRPTISGGNEHWRRWVFLLWLTACFCMLVYKWNAIHWFALGDTDDNIRFDQVRDWINGQGWYDLRQYRLNPPAGANIHWSRLVDLPLAAIILGLKPFFGWVVANKTAVAIAPMIPMLLALYAGAFAVRQLVDRKAYALGCAIMLCGQSTLFMWMPLRIDHHGWQLAFLMCTVAGLADPKPARGGATVGVTSALSMAIGLEMLPYIVFSAAILALHWAWDATEARRLRAYAATLGIGTALSFLVFASNDNWHIVCDALSPVWLSVAVLGALLLGACTIVPVERRWLRFAMAIAAGAIVAATYALAFPKCMGQLEGMSPELKTLWFSHVKEARPLYKHPYDIALPIVALPAAGLIGAWLAIWRARGTALAAKWGPVAVFGTFAAALLLWQTRTGPSAQMLAVPGATALGWAFLPRLADHRLMIVRLFGTVLGFLLVSGLWMYFALQGPPAIAAPWHKATAPAAAAKKTPPNHSGWCFTLPALRQLEKLPPQTMFTFVDFGPRLITLTHHRAIAGPYHRNGDAILDVQHAFRGSAESAHAIIARHHATMLLLCPGIPESTIYQAEAPQGFYMQLIHGQVPAWLWPVPLPKDSPYLLWKVTS